MEMGEYLPFKFSFLPRSLSGPLKFDAVYGVDSGASFCAFIDRQWPLLSDT